MPTALVEPVEYDRQLRLALFAHVQRLADTNGGVVSGDQLAAGFTFQGARILILSMHDDAEYIAESVRAGTNGYLLKDSAATDLRAAVRAVMNGGSFFSSALSRPRVEAIAQQESPITKRERQVLVRVAAGGTNKEIAAALGISHRTVETHRESIARKLGISSVAGQTRYVIEHHLTDD